MHIVCSVEEMMHAFGDDEQPADDTVQLLEEMVLAYMLDLVSPMILLLHKTSSCDYYRFILSFCSP